MDNLLSLFTGEVVKDVGDTCISNHGPVQCNAYAPYLNEYKTSSSPLSYEDELGPTISFTEHIQDRKQNIYGRASDDILECYLKDSNGALFSDEKDNSNLRSVGVNAEDNKIENERANLLDSLDILLQERRDMDHENKYNTHVAGSDINTLLQDEQSSNHVGKPDMFDFSDTCTTSAYCDAQTDNDFITASVSNIDKSANGVCPCHFRHTDGAQANTDAIVNNQQDALENATTNTAGYNFLNTTSIALKDTHINNQTMFHVDSDNTTDNLIKETSPDMHGDSNAAQDHVHEQHQHVLARAQKRNTDMEVTQMPAKRRKRQRDCTASTDPFPLVLPPCRVCNARASGFHYGANTCEACKGFFRRTLAKTRVYFTCRCVGAEKGAWQTGPVRNGCPSCRYERCLFVGMDRNAIKIGRYTLVRRTENIKEVKTLQTLETIFSDVMQDGSDTMSRESQILQQSLELELKSMTSLTPRHVTQSGIEPMKCQQTDFPVSPVADRLEMRKDFVIAQQEIDDIVKVLLEGCHACHRYNNKSACIASIKRRQDECYEQFRLKTAIFGEMKPLSKHEHLEIYKATGIDVDDRLEDIRGAVEFFEKKVRRIIHFAKAIPGFKALSLEDQATLIKCSRVESTFIGSFRRLLVATNMELQVTAVPWGKKAYHLSELTKVYPMELILLRLTLAGELEAIGLTRGEEMLMRAIAVTHTDHCHLQEPEKVRQINAKLLCYLQHLLIRRLGEEEHRQMLAKVFQMFTKLQQLRDLDNKVCKQLFLDYQPVSNYRLLLEFVS